ncbi:MAG: dienelactone hydrolase family protein [Bacteroidota bacterium]
MKGFSHSLLVFCLLIPVAAFSQKGLNPAENSFSKIELRPGTSDATFLSNSGKKWKMRINFPQKIAQLERNTLILALHWAGGYGTYSGFADCLAIPGFRSMDAIIVAPEGEGQLWSSQNNISKIETIIAQAVKHWKVDPKKVVVSGYSNGGNGSWFFAEHYPELFSAAIPMASAYKAERKIKIPLYVVHGEKDELFPLSRTQQWVEMAKKKGSDITLVVNSGLSHFEGCAYTEELKKASQWLNKLWEN